MKTKAILRQRTKSIMCPWEHDVSVINTSEFGLKLNCIKWRLNIFVSVSINQIIVDEIAPSKDKKKMRLLNWPRCTICRTDVVHVACKYKIKSSHCLVRVKSASCVKLVNFNRWILLSCQKALRSWRTLEKCKKTRVSKFSKFLSCSQIPVVFHESIL